MKPTTALLLLVVSACTTPSSPLEAPADGDALSGSVSPPIGAATATPRPPTSLVWWTVPSLAPSEGRSDGNRLDGAIEEFEQAHPEIELRTAVKPGRGRGGIAGLLGLAARVAPATLPDVAVLPLDALADPHIRPLLRPLAGTAIDERLADSFPFAASAAWGGEGEGAVAMPLAVGVVHAIARDREPPASWPEVSGAVPFVVAEPRPDCEALTPLLAWYAASGGSLEALPETTPAALERALGFVADAAADDVFLIAGPEASETQPVWTTFLDEGAATAAVDAGTFARQQGAFPALSWGPLPGPERPAPVVGCGWALVVTSADAERFRVAGAFVEWLTGPERRAWVVEAGYVPPYRSQWSATIGGAVANPPEPAYLAYLEAQLAAASPVMGVDAWGDAWAAGYAAALGGEPPVMSTKSP